MNGVLTSLQSVSKFVKLNEVDAVLVDVVCATVFVVFGTQVDLDDGFTTLFGVHVDSVVEWLVVKTRLTGAYLEVVSFVFLFVFLLVDVNGVADVGVEVVEVSDQTVELYAFYLDTLVGKFVVCVWRQVRFVLLEEQYYFLVQSVEYWVSQGSFELFQSRWCTVLSPQWLVRVTQKLAGVSLVWSVVPWVWRITVGFDYVS